MVKKSILVFIVLSILLSVRLAALDPKRAVTQYMIDTWNDENGLPQNTVRTLLQTSDGYLWIGTEEGLTRFDGVRFTTFDEDNTPEITNNYVFSLFEDNGKNLWIGTREGLLVYKNSKFKRYAKKEGLLYPVVWSISEDSSRNLWIGTDGGGLYLFKDNKFVLYTEKNGLPNNSITDIYCDSKGTLWIGTKGGLSHFKNNKFTNYTENDGLTDDRVNVIYEDSKHRIWIGCEKGFCKLEGGKITNIRKRIDFPESDEINAIFEDRDKNIWIGTSTQGIFRYREGVFSNLSKKNDLSDDAIISIAEDREGSLWVGTVYGGLNCLKDGKFKTFGKKEGLSDDIVFAIYEDRNGDMWIGTNNGLNRIKNDQLTHFLTTNGLTNNAVNVVCEDSNGFIWAGTDDGINQLRISKSKIFKVNEFMRGNLTLGMSEDSFGNLWAGTVRGLVKIRGRNLIRFTKKNGLGADVINFIFEDKNNNLWISTYRGGLTKYKDGKFTVDTKKSGLISDSINCIYEDGEGVLWLGTIDGLSRLKDGRFTNYTKKEGLFNNNIYQILEDRKGNFWMSCNKGIFRVEKKALNDYADGKIKRIRSVSYGKEDGMRSSECNGGLQYAGCKTKDGKLWFATAKGAVNIDPENISTNQVPPPVFIEEVLLDGVSTDLNKEIVLTPGIKRIELHYTALSFLNPKKVKFKYMLEGYENRWVDADTQRVAYYTNLDAGDFRFQVIACNNDGVWNDKGSFIVFTVIPPFWKTWWFTLMALIVFAVFSYIVIHFFRRYISLTGFWKREKYVGNFKLLDKLGAGGMGTVYKAQNLMDKTETVAVKVLREELFEDESNRKRFKQEAVIIDQLDHPNIVKVYERGQSRQAMFIAMELLEGKTLSKKIEEEGKIDISEGLHIMIQITDAMVKIHSKGIVHRDMKPENIMLIEKDNDPNFVKLLDFGLARMQHQTRLTETGMVIGTINYIAPEQISGSSFSGATDIYSMGVMFYEMLTGEKPFVGETTIDVMKQIIDKTPIEPIKFRYDIPVELNDMVLQMMKKETKLRPNIKEVLERLKDIHSIPG